MAAEVCGDVTTEESGWRARESALLGECLLLKGKCCVTTNYIHLYHIGNVYICVCV
jgi:hypothetical protein